MQGNGVSVKPSSGLQKFNVIGADEPCASVKALAVGDSEEWLRERRILTRDSVAFIAFHEIDETVLASLGPSLVYSPLLATSFDCIDLALLLSKLGYEGRYRAVSDNVPKPNLVEREVRQLCPRLDFKIVDTV